LRTEFRRITGALVVVLLCGALASPAAGDAGVFNHAGSLTVALNSPGFVDATSAEIADVTPDGETLIYTDSLADRLGFVDISDPAAPAPAGTLSIDGEPTSVAVLGDLALVAVDTSESFTDPNGELLIIDIDAAEVAERLELAGQPDSVAVSPDQRYAAIVIENQRDEDLNDGDIPQLPGGTLQVLHLKPHNKSWHDLRTVDLTGLATTAPGDPEPEFVDINARNEAVVSLQENNWLAVVDLRSAKVRSDFSAGSVTVEDVDATEESAGPQGNGIIDPSETITRRREPDGVVWIDKDTFATANEGDYVDENGDEGGSRSVTLWNRDGSIEYESGASFEHEVIRHGHYPEARSENKGSEPEGVEFGVFDGRPLLFVGSERANVVGVYDVSSGTPEFVQLLPTGIGPEGLKAVPGRNLLAVTSEEDDPAGVRALITLWRYGAGPARYPYLVSADGSGGLPIPWVAMSGLSGDPDDADTLWAVSDSFLAQAYAYRVDVSGQPAVIRERIPVGGPEIGDPANPSGGFDFEGVAARPEGGFWFASEGRVNVGSSRPNVLVRTDDGGTIEDTVLLPQGLATNATSSGFEGVAVTGSEETGDETVYVAIQGRWSQSGDPANATKIGRYDVGTDTWTFALYPLETVPGATVGLSEITILPDGHTAAIVERDNQIGLNAQLKRIYGIDLDEVEWKSFDSPPLDVFDKTLLNDVLAELDERSISVPDKLEGVGITSDERVFLATDNDGVDANYGETLFFSLGTLETAFGG
jgi:Esterase-like activity of phytase